MKRSYVHLYMAASLTALLLLGACGQAKQDVNRVKNLANPGTMQQLEHGTNYQNDFPRERAMEDNRGLITEDQMKQVLLRMDGVEDAHVIMHNYVVVIGIKANDTRTKKMVEKQTIASISNQYPKYYYHLTADDQLREQIADFKVQSNSSGMHAQAFNQNINALIDAIARSTAVRR